MSCSLPVISPESAGQIGDRLADAEGFFVPPENTAALLNQTERFVRDSARVAIRGGILRHFHVVAGIKPTRAELATKAEIVLFDRGIRDER